MSRQDKVENFMEMAFVVSKRSPDPNTKCGTVLTDNRGRIIGCGYNGFLRDTDEVWPLERGSGGGSPDSKYSYVVHSEINAIYNCVVTPHHIGGGIAYVNGKCCYCCVRDLWQFGIHTIYQGDVLPRMVDDNHTQIIDKIVKETGIKIIDVDCSKFYWRDNFYKK